MSTRTVVKFGTILGNLIRDRIPYFEPAFTEVGSQYLLYGYRKQISTAYCGFILVQASRTQGRFSMEVAVSRGNTYPYHRLGDFPDIALTGYRESVCTLLKGYNHCEEYQTAESLFRVLYTLLKDAEMGLSRLMERCIAKIQSNYEQWQQLYSHWLELEQEASGRPGSRYPSLSAESLAFEIIESNLTRGHFDRYLGPLKYRYRNPSFMNCHVYLLARGLEFLETPERPIANTKVEIPKSLKNQGPLDDPISILTGRWPQEHSVELAEAIAAKTTQFAFLKSLSAVDALLQLDAAGNPMRPDGFQYAAAGAVHEVASELLGTPDYCDHDFVNYPTSLAAEPPPPAAPAQEPVYEQPKYEQPKEAVLIHRIEPKRPKKPLFSDDDDPIAMLENRFGL